MALRKGNTPVTRHTKHYFRAGFLLVGGLVLLLMVRGFLIPRSFGEFGFYRGDNVEEQMNKPVSFAAKDACATCHAAEWEQQQKGAHAVVQCQNCHDRLSAHIDVDKGEMVGPMPIQKTAQLCLRCHMQLPSRPKTHPQINPEQHLKDVPEAHRADICFACHAPHSPKGAVKK